MQEYVKVPVAWIRTKLKIIEADAKTSVGYTSDPKFMRSLGRLEGGIVILEELSSFEKETK